MTRIGLTQRVITISNVQERRDSLDQRWISLLTGLGLVPVPIPNGIVDIDAYFDELTLDGVILTGGGDLEEYAPEGSATPERDRIERALIERCLRGNVPLLGVCRGLQALTVFLGGKLHPVQEHVAVRHELKFDYAFLEGVATPADVNSYHNFGILEEDLPDELHSVALADDSTVEAATYGDRLITGIMWHPERDNSLAEWDRALIIKMFGGASG
jgi:N5-(cytidine 5'-diphosphoramidyl)-L-glutamine hydrolase